MVIVDYDRNKAIEYAKKWAYSRNSNYYDFSYNGGDCTNYASQCLFAGSNQMNYTNTFGWYYKGANLRTASWTGVEYFYNFLIDNKKGVGSGLGPFAEEVSLLDIEVGDFIQLGRATGDFYHTPIVVGFKNGEPLVAAHSTDTFDRLLNSYIFEKIRYIHILGVRKQ